MKCPCTRRNGVFSERLGSETILYDKSNHTAHSLNQTVALVWEYADGQKSVDQLASILHDELGIPADDSVVLLALEELAAAGLLEPQIEAGTATVVPSRREVARKLALAGVSAALIPFVASVLAPTPAMASSSVTAKQATVDLAEVTAEALTDPAYLGSPTAQLDLKNADVAWSHQNYSQEISDLDGVLKALGLPPL